MRGLTAGAVSLSTQHDEGELAIVHILCCKSQLKHKISPSNFRISSGDVLAMGSWRSGWFAMHVLAAAWPWM